MTEDIPNSAVLRRKKLWILLSGVVIFFLTSMAKVLVPTTIFKELMQMNMPVDRIALLGAAFMYAYAASQLVMGCFSDRYGGVRILLIGGTLFASGTIAFPLMPDYCLMVLCRVICGFGAGTIFLGVAKLLNDLFPGNFSFALGTVLLFSYLGPVTGTVPMVKLVDFIGWKAAMIAPGMVSLIPLIVIALRCRNAIAPVTGGQTLEPLFCVIKNRPQWLVCLACASVYGAYYACVGLIGQKILTDIFSFTASGAALCIMILTVIVAVNNMVGNLLLKLFGGRRKAVLLLGTLFSLSGAGLGLYALNCCSGKWIFVFALILLAFPAGFFAMFSLVGKELNPPQYMAMAVAFVNFMAFVFISLYQNITGFVLKAFPPAAGSLAFPLRAYVAVYSFFLIGAIISFAAACLLPETRDRTRN